MIPWIADAKNFGQINLKNINNEILVTTPIQKYLITERDHYLFVIGPKGFGKTLLLMFKRALYSSKHSEDQFKEFDILFIPKDGISRFSSNVSFDENKIQILKNIDNWEKIWISAVSLSIINNINEKIKNYKNDSQSDLKRKIENLSPEIKNLIQFETKKDPFYYLSIILETINIKTLNSLIAYQKYFNNILQDLNFGVYIFIDNVDELFREHEKNPQDVSHSSSNILGETSPEIWYGSQIGLMKASYSLNSIRPHIKVFTTIRSEAFAKFTQIDNMSKQFFGSSLFIQYSYGDLKKIFEMNIKSMQNENLIEPNLKFKNPIEAFLGLQKMNNTWINNEPEDIFDYIYRHSLKNPRDLMIYGGGLENIQKNERQPKTIKKCINDLASNPIAEQYTIEIKPYTNILDFSKLWNLIYSNVLNPNQILKICQEYNERKDCTFKKCNLCKKTHVFCDLYKVGLIGTIEDDHYSEISGKKIQMFLRPGEKNMETVRLPSSDFYLIHPILGNLLHDIQSDKKYHVVKDVIIGDQRPWNSNYDPFTYDVFICHASEDKVAFVDSLVEKLKEHEIEVWYDKFEIHIGDWLHRAIDIGLSKSRFGIVVLSKAFFSKDWPRLELDALANKEINGEKVILPIWYNITESEVKKFSPTLASRLAVDASKGIDHIVDEILREL